MTCKDQLGTATAPPLKRPMSNACLDENVHSCARVAACRAQASACCAPNMQGLGWRDCWCCLRLTSGLFTIKQSPLKMWVQIRVVLRTSCGTTAHTQTSALAQSTSYEPRA